jgi:uncharacterized BrkB/YihY/UPF0761 family membrane protein
VLLLIWVYYSAQILFLGAQFSQTLQHELLGRPQPEASADAPPEERSSIMAPNCQICATRTSSPGD